MISVLFCFIFIVCCLNCIDCLITYRSAVVDFAGVYIPNTTNRTLALQVIRNNLIQYDQVVAKARNSGVQIIVFPEDGLYGPFNLFNHESPSRDVSLAYCDQIPEPQDSPNACLNKTLAKVAPIVAELSCIARKHKIHLVATLGDVKFCKAGRNGCPLDGRFQYNTAIAFNSKGVLIGKYHKTHLFQEPEWNAAPINDKSNLITFKTDFGVTFGMFICFDLLFHWPANALVEAGVKDFVVPQWWVQQDSLQTSNEAQQAWSRTHQVNLLAADSGLSLNYSGSGIYAYGYPSTQYFNPTKIPKTTLLIADIQTNRIQLDLKQYFNSFTPPRSLPNDIDTVGQFSSIQELRATNLGTVKIFLATPGATGTVHVQNGNLTCSAFYKINSLSVTPAETFAIYAYSGNFRHELVEQVCAVTRCTPGKPYCIGWTIESHTTFDQLSVGGTFSKNGVQMPLLGIRNGIVIEPKYVKTSFNTASLVSTVANVLNFAVFHYPYA